MDISCFFELKILYDKIFFFNGSEAFIVNASKTLCGFSCNVFRIEQVSALVFTCAVGYH